MHSFLVKYHTKFYAWFLSTLYLKILMQLALNNSNQIRIRRTFKCYCMLISLIGVGVLLPS